MLNRVRHLDGCAVTALDGKVGRVRDVFFDDARWTIRHLMVDTGSWLSGRAVLISPYAVRRPLGAAKDLELRSTRSQVVRSPEVDAHAPVSRRSEMEVLDYYGYPSYWGAAGLWGMGDYPDFPPQAVAPMATGIDLAAAPAATDDGLLCSCAHVQGYVLHGRDGGIGHVDDFLFDEDSWAIRYFVIRTRDWWPGGTRVLVATRWIRGIDWDGREVHAGLTRDQVKASMVYDDGSPVHRDYEA